MEQKNHDHSVVDSKFLKACDAPLDDFNIEPFTMVIFGGRGFKQKKDSAYLISSLSGRKAPGRIFDIGVRFAGNDG